MQPDNEDNDPGTIHGIIDFIIVTLVRATFSVKMSNEKYVYIHPYSESVGNGWCCLKLIDGDIVLDGEYHRRDHSIQHGLIFRVPLADPDCFDKLVRFLKLYLDKYGSKIIDDYKI